MHHAFPRECPFPHVSGSVTPLSPDEWLDSNGYTTRATREEMMEYTSKGTEKKSQQGESDHWIEHEELLVPVTARRSKSKSSGLIFMLLIGAMIVAALKMAPLDMLQTGLGALGHSDKKADVLPFSAGKSHML